MLLLPSRKYSEADSVAFDLHKVFSSHLCHLSLCKTLELRFMNLDTKGRGFMESGDEKKWRSRKIKV